MRQRAGKQNVKKLPGHEPIRAPVAFVQIDGNTEVANLGEARRRTQKGRDRLSQEDEHTQLRILAEIRVFENAKQSGNQFWREVCIS
jgi:hypothetical protein